MTPIILWSLLTLISLFVFSYYYPAPVKWVFALLDAHQGSAMAVLTFFLVLGIIPTFQNTKIASEQMRIEQQPIILRLGVISSWEWFDEKNVAATSSLLYSVYKNHATNIKGQVSLNGVEYPLLFGLVKSEKDGQINGTLGLTVVGWAAPDARLLVYPDWKKGKKVSKQNQIEISYKDISGISYCSIEDKDFSVSIKKCD